MASPSLRVIDISAVPSWAGEVGVACPGVPGSCRMRSLTGVSINVRFGRGRVQQQAPGCVSLCPTTQCGRSRQSGLEKVQRERGVLVSLVSCCGAF